MRRYVGEHVPRRVLENLATISIVVFLGVLAWGFKEVTDLGRENKDRIAEIQASRVYSCQQTYRALRRGLALLVPPARQNARYYAARRAWDPRKCGSQTQPKGD